MPKMSTPKSQSGKVSANASYSGGPKRTGAATEGRNSPPPKVANVGTSKTVKAKPQAGVYPGRN